MESSSDSSLASLGSEVMFPESETTRRGVVGSEEVDEPKDESDDSDAEEGKEVGFKAGDAAWNIGAVS